MTDAATILGPGAAGDPDAVAMLASRLSQAADDVDGLRSTFGAPGLHGAWDGAASDAFRAAVGEVSPELDKVVASYGHASSALSAYAGSLRDVQQRARAVATRIDEAQASADQAKRDHGTAHATVTKASHASAAAPDPAAKTVASNALAAASAALRAVESRQSAAATGVKGAQVDADAIRHDFDKAVKACARGLDDASHMGIRSDMFTDMFHAITESPVTAVLEAFAGAVANTVVNAVLLPVDLAAYLESGDLDDLSQVLDDMGAIVAIVGVAVFAVAVVTTGGVALALAAPELLALNAIGFGISAAKLGVDVAADKPPVDIMLDGASVLLGGVALGGGIRAASGAARSAGPAHPMVDAGIDRGAAWTWDVDQTLIRNTVNGSTSNDVDDAADRLYNAMLYGPSGVTHHRIPVASGG